MIDDLIAQANSRLKAAHVGIAIERIGKKLRLRGILPPKPGATINKPFQQRLSLSYHANPAGLKLAEAEARKVGALVDCKEFHWGPYLKHVSESPRTVAEWVELFEADYFQRRDRNAKSESTWESDYLKVFSKLPSEAGLTAELLRAAVLATSPDTRTRKRFCDVLGRLGKFANLEVDFNPFKGSYSSKTTAPRQVPSDQLVATWFHQIPSREWRWAFGILATYGLRNHELFYLDFSKLPVLLVTDGAKTGYRRVYPLYPEWVEQWNLFNIRVPRCTGKNNSALGNRVTHAFKRYGVPFNPYDLRHGWAVRSLEFGLPIELAAQQMGHSVQVHSETYHHWISEEVHDRAFQAIVMRSDRPKVPVLSR